ncbi:MAG: hypothetical protein BroJett030_23200 [Alphaproteobacteria bacterium]|nr:MAG: hypothetical protein BroJett030_23200 [Alphaproteobacteria bacterium]
MFPAHAGMNQGLAGDQCDRQSVDAPDIKAKSLPVSGLFLRGELPRLRPAILSMEVKIVFLRSIGRLATPSNPLGSGSATGTGRAGSSVRARFSSVASVR